MLALPNHTQALLYRLLECAAYGHHLADTLHRRAEQFRHAVELVQVPARDLADDVIQRRLEACRGDLRHRILYLVQAVSETELRRHECQRITRSLRREGARTRQSGIDLDDTVILRLGIQSILHVALAHDTYVSDDAYGDGTELMVLAVGERLRRSHDQTLARMYSERVKVLHVADRDTVVIAVAHDLVLDLLPTLERLLNKYLRRV